MTSLLEKKATICVAISATLYGFMGFFGSKLLHIGFPLSSLLFYRFFGASFFCFIGHFLLQFFSKENKENLSKKKSHGILKTYIFPTLWGFLFYSLSPLFYFNASQYVGTGVAMVLFFVFPVFVIILSLIFTEFKLTRFYATAFLIILSGLALLALADSHDSHFSFKGVLLGIASATTYSFYVFLSKKTSSYAPPLLQTSCVCFGSSLFFLACCIFRSGLYIPHTFYTVSMTLIFSFVCTAIPTFLMMYGLKHIDAFRASLITVLEPITCVLAGVAFLHERFSLQSFFGTFVVLLGSLWVMIPRDTLLSLFHRLIPSKKTPR